MAPEVEHAINALKDADLAHFARILVLVLTAEHRENQQTLETLKKDHAAAFPAGDGIAHRIGHEERIKRDIEEAKFWAGLKGKVAAGGALAVIATTISALGYYMLRWIAEHLPK